MDLSRWNAEGRRKNKRVCKAFDAIIDDGGSTKEDLTADAREPKLADAVLKEVVALNAKGKWQEARERFDTAHGPFVPHMNKTPLGFTAVAILGADSFLVRRGDWSDEGPVLHLDEGSVKVLKGVLGFAMSRNRACLAFATKKGVTIGTTADDPSSRLVPWPEGKAIRPATFVVANDGKRLVIANDEAGVWLLRDTKWTKLLPRKGVGDDDEPDVIHATISPDGRHVAYGWQDAPGHYVENVEGGKITRVGVVGTISDTPYLVHFTDDGTRLLSNTRHMQSGVTLCAPLAKIRGKEEYADVPDSIPRTDEYLRANGLVLLPPGIASKSGKAKAKDDAIAWIGGAGWSHAAPLKGGKPVFTQLLGSALDAFDYDPVSKRAVVASAASVLHVIDPWTRAEPGRERGYRPRRELYRWIFWDTLKAPIRW